MRLKLLALGMLAASLLTACGNPKLASTPVINTAQGPVQGEWTEDKGIANFKGLPYAAAPVGKLRWAAPVKAAKWNETRQAKAFSPMCMQPADTNGVFFKRIIDGHGLGSVKKALITRVVAAQPEAVMSEDCLYLNVRTAGLSEDGSVNSKAPVMVWIHGGGHQFGSGGFNYYQGNGLVKKGVTLVTINYRLGPFGYMAHPALSADSPNGVSGNYGLMDQIAALEWVRDNIASYGGDPENVTIFGESAGAWSVTELMSSPMASGLFHRAIGQSGASSYHLGDLIGNATKWPSGHGGGLEAATKLGFDQNVTSAQLRAVSAEDIQIKVAANAILSEAFHPIRDGYVLPKNVGIAFRDGDINAVPTLFGYNTDEATLFFPDDPQPSVWLEDFPREDAVKQAEALNSVYPGQADTILSEYALSGDDFDMAGTQLMGDDIFGVNVRYVTRKNEAAGQDAWLYSFSRVPPSETQTLGAFHAAEIPFVFNTHEKVLGLTKDDETLTEMMQTYWVNFAKTGNPNGEGIAQWAPHQGKNWMHFAGNTDLTSGPITHFRKAKLDALETGLSKHLDMISPQSGPSSAAVGSQ